MPAIEVERLTKSFDGKHKALNAVSLRVEDGEMVALIGASGSGKSTLIRHLSGLVTGARSSGSIHVLNHEVQNQGRLARDLRRLRVRVGIIFQQFNLVSRLSLLTNVQAGILGRIPAWRGCLGLFTRQEQRQAMEALQRVGMAKYAAQRASTLSGGQQQRGAIARTLVQQAEIILADEPIASLDPESARRVMDLLARVNREDGRTIVVSLHQVEYAINYCPRTLALREGQVVYDGPSSALTPDFLREIYGAESDELFAPTEPDPVDRQSTPPVREPEPALAV